MTHNGRQPHAVNSKILFSKKRALNAPPAGTMRSVCSMFTHPRQLTRATACLLTCLMTATCGRAEDPARTALRDRLSQDAQLSDDDLGRLRAEISRSIADKTFLITQGDTTRTMDDEQRTVVFGMLSEPMGMFDEGVRQEGGVTVRVLNAPGRSTNSEIEASRRLSIDIETLLPLRFQFAYAFPNPEDYSLELVVRR